MHFADEVELLRLTFGICLVLTAWLVFSIWRDKLTALKDEERLRFLMYNIAGGSWLVAVFALCGGFYFLLEPIFR